MFRLNPERTFITFGVCFPAACPVEIFEEIFNTLIPKHTNNFAVQLPKDTCQIENNDSKLTNKEKITM